MMSSFFSVMSAFLPLVEQQGFAKVGPRGGTNWILTLKAQILEKALDSSTSGRLPISSNYLGLPLPSLREAESLNA